CQQHNSNPWTF
nr:immunoglobulin light chain junction region [Macaca mulatta]MOX57444.1 immunoglobulin light chain junction region [Macaca mulatta]